MSDVYIILDLVLLAIFVIGIFIFLYTHKKNLKKEGLLYLYKTEWGIKLIHKVGEKYQKTLKFLSYISITVGYLLMAGVIYMFGKIVWLYVFNQQFVRAVKIPPIMPLIPYLPSVFKLDFLPNLPFIIWIIALAIIAIPHEFAHGIFAARDKIKIKKTGFGFFPYFFPIFLAAFVEPDEKDMEKKGIFSQMAVLSAGTFANIITSVLVLIVLIAFFSVSFSPGGVAFESYAYDQVYLNEITKINGLQYENLTISKIREVTENESFIFITAKNRSYIASPELLELQKENENFLMLFYDAPAIKNGLIGAIKSLNGQEISSLEEFSQNLNQYKIGDNITLEVNNGTEINIFEITLEENPYEKGKPWLGVKFRGDSSSSPIKVVLYSLGGIRDNNTLYEPKFEGARFIYDLLWWIVIISVSVAFVNMLPAGIFDGGRFFYLTILKITRNEKIALISYKFVTALFLLLVFALIIFWGIGIA